MLAHGSILVSLLWLVEQLPVPPPAKRQRGRQATYSDKLFVKALIVMLIRRLYTAYALLHFLEQDDPVALQIRPLLMEHGPIPTSSLSMRSSSCSFGGSIRPMPCFTFWSKTIPSRCRFVPC